MQLIRFKCKTTGRTFQEEHGACLGCEGCAFKLSKVELEEEEVQEALYKHCLNTDCGNRHTIFVEVTE